MPFVQNVIKSKLSASGDEKKRKRLWKRPTSPKKWKRRVRSKFITNFTFRPFKVRRKTEHQNLSLCSAQRERQEFERILREQQRQITKEQDDKAEKQVEMKVHSQLLRQQIQNREQERIEERKAFFEESDTLTAEQEEHERKIQKVWISSFYIFELVLGRRAKTPRVAQGWHWWKVHFWSCSKAPPSETSDRLIFALFFKFIFALSVFNHSQLYSLFSYTDYFYN